MKYRIHFQHEDGTDDDFVVSGPDVSSIRNLANAQLKNRGIDIDTAWSEKLKEKP